MKPTHIARLPLLLALLVLVSSASLPAQLAETAQTTELQEILQAKLAELQTASGAPGVTAGVVLADGASFGLAAGMADTVADTPMTAGGRLMQGSVGKTYVSAVAMQLVGEGRLDLDAKVSAYLGDEPWFERLPNAAEVTVRQLMNHTSGIIRYEFDDRFIADLLAQPDKVWEPVEQLAYLFDTEAPFAAGEGWDYSDTNYIVLGLIIEGLTGAEYYDELRRRILVPLELRNTVPSDSRRVPGLVQGYAGAENMFGLPDAVIEDGQFAVNPQFEWTGGGIASTSEDLARWAKELYEGRAFDPALLSTMLDGVPARLGRSTQYGLGVIIRQTPLGVSWGHSGFFPGYLTEMAYFPDHKIAVAVQYNSSDIPNIRMPPGAVLMELARLVVEADVEEDAPQDAGWRTIEFETAEVTAPDVAVTPDGEWLIFTMLGHLYRVPAQGGEAEQLTFGPYYDSGPAVSPDGQRVAFVSDREESEGNIFVLDLSNQRIRQVTHEAWVAKPRWSHDGQKLVYLSYDMEAEQQFPFSTPVSLIRVVPAAGGEPRSLTREAAVLQTVFFLSDGRVGYVRQRGAMRAQIEALSLAGGHNAIDSVAVLEGLVWEVIPAPYDSAFFYHRNIRQPGEEANSEEWVSRPVTGRDERRLATMRHTGRHPRAGIAADGSALYLGDQGKLWRVDIRTGARDSIPFRATVRAQVREPTPPPRRSLGDTEQRPVSIATPRLSPDGQRLVFRAAGYLWVQPLTGGLASRVTDGSAVERDPAFSPDGRLIAFVRSEFGRHDLVVHDVASGETRVIDSGVAYGPPDWSPDGRRVVFSDGQRIVGLDLESGARQTLTAASGWLPRPHFSGDGRSLFFSANDRGTGALFELALSPDREAASGNRPRPLTELDRHLSGGLVSPDGRWLAFRRNTEIWLALRGSESIREKDVRRLSVEGGDSFAFTPDGSALVYSAAGQVFRHSLGGTSLDSVIERRAEEIPIRLELSGAVPPPRLLRRVRLLDFETGSFGRETSLLVESGRIRAIGPEAERDLPAGTEILDAAGRYAIPGLFDMHVHVSRRTTEEGFLAYGITSVRDCGWWIGWLETMSDRSMATDDPVPRHFYAGGQFLGARPASTDVDLLLHDEAEARVYVHRWQERGAHFVKLYGLRYSLDGGRPRWLHRAVADQGHRLRIPVAGHGATLEEVVNAVTLGYTVIEHTTFLIPVHDDVLQLLAAAGTRWDPTLGMPGGAVGTARLLRLQPERLEDPKLLAFTLPRAVAMAPYLYPWVRASDLEHIWRVKLANVGEAHRRGIQLLIGTDVYVAGEGDQAFVGSALHWEMEHFVEAEISPLEVLSIATRAAAEAVGAEDDLGTLKVGKFADIVLLDADPLESIRNTQRIWKVMKGGWVFDPDTLRPPEP